ncbi:hypothetical protein SNEBB_006737 [Seison nebaliae]|nr:hypothetical protein SNEBB_006737 [Seison nebaliae]
MSLIVKIISATNVPNKEKFGQPDPFVYIEFQGIKKKTSVKKEELNPVWDEDIKFDLKGIPLQTNNQLDIHLKDYERFGANKLLGKCTVPLRDVIEQASSQYELELKDPSDTPLPQSKLTIKLIYEAPDVDTEGGDIGSALNPVNPEGGLMDEQPDSDDDGGNRSKDMGDVLTSRRKERSSKQQDFQIRIKIIEARQLEGGNIHPVCRVKCHNQSRQTRIKRSTSNPIWSEIFFFNFSQISEQELFDEFLEFEVYNSRQLRSDAYIGGFKCDIGYVADEPKHAVIRKWLLLSNSDDAIGGVKGYLKATVVILEADMEPPVGATADVVDDDTDDIESNLLKPAGMTLKPAQFILRLFKAEDLPRMDSEVFEGVKKLFSKSDDKKELVDPYVVMTFAGKSIQSKIAYCDANPEFNQELKLGLKFPSMCEKIRLQIKDWDRLSANDNVAVTYLKLPQISSNGYDDDAGFLPTFGPCFINLYGSPREYSELPDQYDDMNLGKYRNTREIKDKIYLAHGEGVAYRGRMLVELTTDIGPASPDPIVDIAQSDMIRVQSFLSRRKFKLHAAFLDATMIMEKDSALEFEVSIGNYGNKLDESLLPCSSTTQPSNAVFDGCSYYFLPWGDTKPCVQVESHWEDVTYRLKALNMLQAIIDRLNRNLREVEIMMKSKVAINKIAGKIIEMLDTLIQDCKCDFPPGEKPTEYTVNDLDKLLYNRRKVEIEKLLKKMKNLRLNATDPNDVVRECENFSSLLENLCIEPQNSIPDIIIWLITGSKRIAYYRIPANELLYSSDEKARGKYCGKLQNIFLKWPGKDSEAKDKKYIIPGQLRMKLWFGLEKDEEEWVNMQKDGEVSVFAETYENEVNLFGKWTNHGPTMTRPSWSDVTGAVDLKKDNFNLPYGWNWKSDWYISPESSLLYDKDSGHRTYMEEVYENEYRKIPGARFNGDESYYTDIKGDNMPSLDNVPLPDGWEWMDEWEIDVNRAVDENGWEYCVEATLSGWTPTQKTFHLCRRRRWLRKRQLQDEELRSQKKNELALAMKEGWEYAPLFNMKFHAKEKSLDMVRRRRWHRQMIAERRNASSVFAIEKKIEQKPKSFDEGDEEGRESAPLVQEADFHGSDAMALNAPRLFLSFKKSHTFQLRVYIFQARELFAADSDSLSDPYCQISFLNQSQKTEVCQKNLCPMWDQTLIFESIEIHGNLEELVMHPPTIVVEMFDHDNYGKPDFLGRVLITPLVKVGEDVNNASGSVAKLQWHNIARGTRNCGELLGSAELLHSEEKENELPNLPPKKGNLYIVPNTIRPVMKRTAVEVLCWGVRNMKKYQLLDIKQPSVEFECGGTVVTSERIKNMRHSLNFNKPLLFFDVMLPEEELYAPPINIKVYDHRIFGTKPLIGSHVVKSVQMFRADPNEINLPLAQIENRESSDVIVDMEPPSKLSRPEEKKVRTFKRFFGGDSKSKYKKKKNKSEILAESMSKSSSATIEEDIDWWSKFYASIGDTKRCGTYEEKGYEKIKVYDTTLEESEHFNYLTDFCNTFSLRRGKQKDNEEDASVGEFKASFKVYPLPPDPNAEAPPRILNNLPSSKPSEYLVRIYCIRAMDLQPKDNSGLADPYVECHIGKQTINNRDDYCPNNLNPEFGRMFELKTFVPTHKDLEIRVKDYDMLTGDEIIGQTTIDLENRSLTKFRATCGLPFQYYIDGPNQWRDSKTPKEILIDLCKKYKIEGPDFITNASVRVGGHLFSTFDFEQEKRCEGNSHVCPDSSQRLSLYMLHRFGLVPEHVETRPLFNPLQPGIEQGRMQLFVDMYKIESGPPSTAFNIVPRKPSTYVLRAIVWNTKDVIMDETSITGEQMSDIYVKGWLTGIEDEGQKTDIHYRSMDGEGNFNWRFLFPFNYLPAEQSVVIKKKEHFWSLDATEQRLPSVLNIQIWDNDQFSPDDFLGMVTLNLNSMIKPAKDPSKCSLKLLPDLNNPNKKIKQISLFEQRRLRGWWPCINTEENETILAGKVELELEILTEEEANEKPAGLGRDEPNINPKLDPPKRPETSFLWITSPWKTFKFIIWRRYKWWFLGILLIVLVAVFIILFFYAVPPTLVNKALGG